MVAWYDALQNWQQCCLWILVFLSVVGIMRLLYLCYRICWYDKRLVEQYIDNARIYANCCHNNFNNVGKGELLVRKSNEVSTILDESIYDMPALEFAAKIKFGNIYNVATLDDLVRKIYANYLCYDEKRKDQRNRILLQLFIPFVFWAFRGVEACILFFIEILMIIGIKSIKPDSKSLYVLSVLGGVIGFLGSIASILSFFGIGLGNNVQ